MNEEYKSSQHEVIEKFCKENQIELMHLELYLMAHDRVIKTKQEHEEGE